MLFNKFIINFNYLKNNTIIKLKKIAKCLSDYCYLA